MHTLANWDESEIPEDTGMTNNAAIQEEQDTGSDHEALDETIKTVQDAPPQKEDITSAETADTHAETALTQPLSFADLQARLAARAQRANEEERERTQTTDVRSDDHESE